jgi:hypothetical protein
MGADATVKFAGPGTNPSVTTTGLTNGGESLATSTEYQLEITCVEGADCTKAEVNLNDDLSRPEDQDGGTIELTLALAGNELKVSYGGSQKISTTVAVQPGGGTVDGNTKDTEEVPLEKLLQNPCTDVLAQPQTGYSREGNLSVRAVDITGRMLSDPQENMDEDDSLVLYVLVDRQLAPLVSARRKSAIRTVGALQIVGNGIKLNLPKTLAQAAGPGACEYKKFTLDSFAPGTGEVEIQVSQGSAQPLAVGGFDFIVHRLYDGMFSLGALRSDLVDRSFKLTPQGDDKVIYASENGDQTTLYAVFYTPFVWGKRDIEKDVPNPLHRLNPTFGVSINNFADNALIGATYDFPRGILLVGGLHLSRVSNLAGGLKEGDVFTGEQADIATKKEWDQGWFLGVSIDLRAAGQLLDTVFGGVGD